MMDVLEKQLAHAIDARLAVFERQAADGSLLQDTMELEAAAYLISEIMLPCCCMVCNRGRLLRILQSTRLCAANEALAAKLAEMTYLNLARFNGLG